MSGLVLGRRPLGAILHSSNEPGELSQWLCHVDSTINIVLVIIIIIIIIRQSPMNGHCSQKNVHNIIIIKPNGHETYVKQVSVYV